ncbi:MAG: hypothetical protein V4550_05875 [Gemmatimonadota bacterium]
MRSIEPLATTLLRTTIIAMAAGAAIGRWTHGIVAWPLGTLCAFWPSLGGHYVELWYLTSLRPRLERTRSRLVIARLATWFAAGVAFVRCMALTADLLAPQRAQWPAWWLAGIGFVVIELVVHALLQLRGRPSFYNGRG